MIRSLLASILLCAALAACGSDADDITPASASTPPADPLPAPQPARGSVTGMPDGPGPGDVPLGGRPAEALETAPHGDGLPPLAEEPEAGLTAGDPQMIVGGRSPPSPMPAMPGYPDGAAAEPSAGDAVAVVRDYYAAIASGDHGRAYAFWSDGGRSSGQTPQQFAAGFADTRTVRVQPGEPGNVEGAAGSRYVEVPVSVTTTDADGREQRYVGAYVLRRATADGATVGQRAWRIASAELREYRP